MDEQLDAVARRLRAELIEIAVDQISKPIAHEFDIRIDLAEIDGGPAVLVNASSRSVQPVTTQVRVTVRPSGEDLVVERAGTSHRVDVDLDDADPIVTEHLHHRLSDFVARCIAAVIAQLNAEMQRRLGQHGGWSPSAYDD